MQYTGIISNQYILTVFNPFLSFRIIRFMVRHVKYLLGLRFEVSGWEHLQTEGPYVVISNHQSSLDVLGESFSASLKTDVFDIDLNAFKYSHTINFFWHFSKKYNW